MQFVIGMAQKRQKEANCNLENTNKITNDVREGREEEKGNNHVSHANVDLKDFQNAINNHKQDFKISREVGAVSYTHLTLPTKRIV